jgi:Tfp pilus assembly protein PilX
MKTPSLIFENEHGSTIIVAMLILVFLTIIGISAINTNRRLPEMSIAIKLPFIWPTAAGKRPPCGCRV